MLLDPVFKLNPLNDFGQDTHNTLAALIIQQLRVARHKFKHLRADRRRQKLTRATSVSGSGENLLGFVTSTTVVLLMRHILFSMRIAARQQRHDMPPF